MAAMNLTERLKRITELYTAKAVKKTGLDPADLVVEINFIYRGESAEGAPVELRVVEKEANIDDRWTGFESAGAALAAAQRYIEEQA